MRSFLRWFVVLVVFGCTTVAGAQNVGLIGRGVPSNSNGRSVLTLNDLTWEGGYKFATGGSSCNGCAGSISYSSGALAVRYVGGQRRYLMPTFNNNGVNTAPAQFGDLIEFSDPVSAKVTSNFASAPSMVETRRWANWSYIHANPTPWVASNGVRVGGMYWDEANGVLWYQAYAYYSAVNNPILFAVQLLDTVVSGNYRVVGTAYGPWWWRTSDPSNIQAYWKLVFNFMTPIPSSSQTGGKNLLLGGCVGAIAGQGHIGPGMNALVWPSLSDPANTVLTAYTRIADYSAESVGTINGGTKPAAYQSERDIAYTAQFGNTPGYSGGGTIGHWQMSLDQCNGMTWIETNAREGVLIPGRQVTGYTWYGYNPCSNTPAQPTCLGTDPSRPNPDNSDGYGGEIWTGVFRIFNPVDIRAVGAGTLPPFSDRIRPTTYDVEAKWPNLPMWPERKTSSETSGTTFFDSTTKELIWIQPRSWNSGQTPTLQFFLVP